MPRNRVFFLAMSMVFQSILAFLDSLPALAQKWAIHEPRGTLKVVDLYSPSGSVMLNYAEGLVTVDKEGNVVPCLAKDWRWLNDRTIEFRLRADVWFHNGEKFDAEAVRVNWEAYKRMENPRVVSITNLPDSTVFEKIDDYMVRFTLPQPDGLAFVKFRWFFQVAPAFFEKHKVREKNWVYLQDPGPWGTGPFKLVEGGVRFPTPSDRVVLEAYENYWDPKYPKVKQVIFDNTLIKRRELAMKLCSEKEGVVDIMNRIRPLDTLKVAESLYAKVMKSKDVTLLHGMFNQRKKDSKWKDIRLRKAINYGINREELWKHGAKGNAYNLGGFIPPGAYGYNPNISLYTYDTPKAKTLLAEAGYPNGFGIKCITWEARKLETQIVKKMLERVGLDVQFEVLSYPEFVKKVYMPAMDKPPEEQDWDLAIMDSDDYYNHTGATFLTIGLTEKGDFRWIDYDSEYEEMWRDMATTVDAESQEEKIRRMVKYVYEQAYALFIYSPLALYAVNREVNFVAERSPYLRLKETSVTENHWSIREQNN